MRAQLVGFLLAIPIAVLGSAPAHACSCVGGSWPVWPPDGAADIPLDAPIVVATSDLTQVETKLTADDGSEVELVERGRLQGAQVGCDPHNYLFLAPKEPLQPQHAYVLLSRGGANPLLAGAFDLHPVSFVTGSALRDALPSELSLHLYATPQPEGHDLELFIEPQQLTEPVFVGVAAQHLDYAWGILPSSASGSAAEPLRLALGSVDCAAPTLIDVTGTTFASPRVCEPSKCSAPQTLVRSPCGGELASPLSWDDWQKLPDGCSAGTDDDSTKVSDSGCTLQPSAPRRAASPALLLAALAPLRRAAVRRSHARGSSLRGSARL